MITCEQILLKRANRRHHMVFNNAKKPKAQSGIKGPELKNEKIIQTRKPTASFPGLQ